MQLQPEKYKLSQPRRARVRQAKIGLEEGSLMDQIVFISSTAFLLNYQLSSGPSLIFPHQSNLKFTISAKLSLKPAPTNHINQEGWMQMLKFPRIPLLPSPVCIYWKRQRQCTRLLPEVNPQTQPTLPGSSGPRGGLTQKNWAAGIYTLHFFKLTIVMLTVNPPKLLCLLEE